MVKPLSLFLALRYVSRRNSNGFASFISASSTVGIALGVLVLIVVLSAMNGFEKALAERLLSVVSHGELIAVEKPFDDWRKTATKIEQNKDVLAAAPLIKMSGMLQSSGALKGVELHGVEPTLELKISDINRYVNAGSWQALNENNTVVIGSGIAKKLKLAVGDSLQLLLPQASGKLEQQFSAPIVRQIKVAAIFNFGGVIDDSLAYISLAQAQELSNFNSTQASAIRLKVPDVFNAHHITREVAFELDHYVYINDWMRTQGHLFQDIQLVRMVMFLVLALVIGVASFNIVSTLIMVVNEKKGDIAILKTMGASPLLIMLCFVIQGLINGVLGTVIGCILGVYLALNLSAVLSTIEQFFSMKFLSGDVYFIDFIPSELHWPDVQVTVAIALLLSLVATIYPAWRATKVDPAQVLGQL